MPNTATREAASRSRALLPKSNSVLENACSIANTYLFNRLIIRQGFGAVNRLEK